MCNVSMINRDLRKIRFYSRSIQQSQPEITHREMMGYKLGEIIISLSEYLKCSCS